MTHAALERRLAGPMGASLLLHIALVVGAVFGVRRSEAPALPPFYRVNIVAAPAGERAIGEVRPDEAPPAPVEQPPPMAPAASTERVVPLKDAPQTKTSTRATPVAEPAKASKAPAPRAGGGPTGGTGTDVATVQTAGIEFPFPWYLNNIVRQVALQFKPGDRNSARRADVRFLIRRDGSISNFSFVTRSGSYSFDLEAQGAIEAASREFGPLPDGFSDDVLPVVFSFDPSWFR